LVLDAVVIRAAHQDARLTHGRWLRRRAPWHYPVGVRAKEGRSEPAARRSTPNLHHWWCPIGAVAFVFAHSHEHAVDRPTSPRRERPCPRTRTYQKIWTEDVERGNGLRAIKKGATPTPTDEARGYVVVDEKKEAGPQHALLPKVVIPESK